mmetsp:Transcript_25434/g.64064  ORF Transcript_25434/g.64064 Transcript_25434/m.64064 type:complete len:227 (-) Transcript_25434:39-719(-)
MLITTLDLVAARLYEAERSRQAAMTRSTKKNLQKLEYLDYLLQMRLVRVSKMQSPLIFLRFWVEITIMHGHISTPCHMPIKSSMHGRSMIFSSTGCRAHPYPYTSAASTLSSAALIFFRSAFRSASSDARFLAAEEICAAEEACLLLLFAGVPFAADDRFMFAGLFDAIFAGVRAGVDFFIAGEPFIVIDAFAAAFMAAIFFAMGGIFPTDFYGEVEVAMRDGVLF